MTIDLNDFLAIVLYIALIVLVIVFIVLGIKLIKTLGKVDNVIDDVSGKMNKVDGLFNIIDRTTDYASSISDKIIGGITSFVNILFKRKRGNGDDE